LFLQSAGKHDAIKKRLIRALTCDCSIMLAEATDCDSWQQQQQHLWTATLDAPHRQQPWLSNKSNWRSIWGQGCERMPPPLVLLLLLLLLLACKCSGSAALGAEALRNRMRDNRWCTTLE